MPALIQTTSKGDCTVRVAYLGPMTGYTVKVFKVGKFNAFKKYQTPDRDKALQKAEEFLREIPPSSAVQQPGVLGIPITDWEERIRSLDDTDILLYLTALKVLEKWTIYSSLVTPSTGILSALLQVEYNARKHQEPLPLYPPKK